jgi:hypothetical protein
VAPFVIEIFSGSDRLGKAIVQEGYLVLLWDIELGEQYDLTKRSAQHKILGWITSGMVLSVHCGFPCSSFSRARDVPPGPPALRSDA